MDKGGAAVAQLGGLRAACRYQWLVFLVVWLGWTLDAADFGLYSLALKPAMTELLGGNPSLADIGKYGRLLSMAGLLGWAFGGFLFGILADYIGRVRTLGFSIALYSFSPHCKASRKAFRFCHLPVYRRAWHRRRIDGRLPLLAETLAETHRAKTAATMMTGGAFGGSFSRVTAFMTCFALLSMPAMLLGPRNQGQPAAALASDEHTLDL